LLGQRPCDERADGSTQIDSHIKDGESGIATRIARFIERSDHCADVWFEQTGTKYNQNQAGIEERKFAKRKREVSESNENAAKQDASILAEQPIGNESAGNGHGPDASGIKPVNIRGAIDSEAESAFFNGRHHVKNQECAHSIVAEAFPHFCEKKCGHSTWMSEPLAIFGGWRAGYDCGVIHGKSPAS